MADSVRKTDRHYTNRDRASWPDDERWELVDGVAWNMSPAPSTAHQRVLGHLYRLFAEAAEGSGCEVLFAPVDVFPFAATEDEIDDADTVVQPDLIVACDPARLVRRGHLGPPAVVVEVLSPRSLKKDLTVKVDVYQRAGVREYWLVSPGEQSVMIYRRGEDGRYPDEPEIALEAASARSDVLDRLVVALPLPG